MVFFDLSPAGIVYSFSQLIGAPFQNPSILWFGLPLIIAMIVIELNLTRNNPDLKQAIPNAIILIFISLDLARTIFSRGNGFVEQLLSFPMLAVIAVFAVAWAILIIDYQWRLFPRRAFFGISVLLVVNTFTYSMMVLVYNQIPLTLSMLTAIAILVAFLWLLFRLSTTMEKNRNTDYSSPSSKRDFFSSKPKKKSAPASSSSPKGGSDIEMGDAKLVWLKK